MAGRVRAMRELAEELMTVLEEFDPFLIGSTLSGADSGSLRMWICMCTVIIMRRCAGELAAAG